MKYYNKKYLFIFLPIVIIVIITVIAPFRGARAGFGINSPFGGKIITQVPCTCSKGYQIKLSAPSAGTYLYIPGSARLFSNRSVVIGKWILGFHTPAGTCLVGAKPYCTTLPITKGTISVMIGTS